MVKKEKNQAKKSRTNGRTPSEEQSFQPIPRKKVENHEEISEGDRDVLDEGDPIQFEVVEISPANKDIPTDSKDDPDQSGDFPINFMINDANATEPADEITRYAEDEGVKEEFQERQVYAQGSEEILDKLKEHHDLSPEISGGDLDAAWDEANASGEETVGGSTPTPDQDVVDELGQAAGLTYQDTEPLNYDKVSQRDRDRWELNPASSDDLDEIEDEYADDELIPDLSSRAGVNGAGASEKDAEPGDRLYEELDDEGEEDEFDEFDEDFRDLREESLRFGEEEDLDEEG